MATSTLFLLDLLDQHGDIRRKRVPFRRSFWLVEAQTCEEAWRKVYEMRPAVGDDGKFAAVLNLVPVQIVDERTMHLFSNVRPWPKKLKFRKVVKYLDRKTALHEVMDWEQLVCSLLPEEANKPEKYFLLATLTTQRLPSGKRNVVHGFWRVCAPCAVEAYHNGVDSIKRWLREKSTAGIGYDFLGVGAMDVSKDERLVSEVRCILPCFDKFEKRLRDRKIFLRNLERRYGRSQFMKHDNL